MNDETKHSIADSVLAALLYYDVFSHPLTVEEAHAFMPTNSVTAEDVREAVAGDRRIARVTGERDMLFVAGADASCVAVRAKKERRASRRWRTAARITRFIAAFPFVRALIVTGSLSKNAVECKSDIDWFIITAPGRLWICKALLTAFRRVFLFNNTRYFCTSYYVGADALEIPDRNVFVATEIATAQPALNGELCAEFQRANAWIRAFLPNAVPRGAERLVRAGAGVKLRTLLERPFGGKAGDRLERLFYIMHGRYFARKHGDLSAENFDLMFRTRPGVCKVHHLNFQSRVLAEYERRLRAHGIRRLLVEEPPMPSA